MTGKELARLLSVSPETIRSWTSQRKIPFVRVGSKAIRYEPAEVRKIFETVEPVETVR